MTKHMPRTPKPYAGIHHLRYIDCSCGWGGRITSLADAQAEQAAHARGEVMQWEIDAAHFDAILEERRRVAAV